MGVCWRTSREEAAGDRRKIQRYLDSLERAGAAPELLSLVSGAAEFTRRAAQLDAFVLPGSPADVDPARFSARPHPAAAPPDPARERADFALLEHALHANKPVLAICYGTQSLNVFLGGTLIQDIPGEVISPIRHSPQPNREPGGAEPSDEFHPVQLEDGRIQRLCGAASASVNSWHHQSILQEGRQLRVTARAPDGVVEAVEWTGGANWVVGVQWHPERMPDDLLARALFRELVAAAQRKRIG